MKRDHSSREEASSRLKSQLSISEKVGFADYVIENSGSPQDLEIQVNALLMKVDKEVGRVWWRLSWVIPPFGALSALSTLVWRAIWRAKEKRKR
jgi:dephospho-CoA kinase